MLQVLGASSGVLRKRILSLLVLLLPLLEGVLHSLLFRLESVRSLEKRLLKEERRRKEKALSEVEVWVRVKLSILEEEQRAQKEFLSQLKTERESASKSKEHLKDEKDLKNGGKDNMAIVVASGTAVSIAANTKSADQVAGQYQHVGRGKFTLIALNSATGSNITCAVGGINLVNDQPIPFTGTAGGISTTDHVMCSQVLNGGRVELFIRNTTAGALTTDYILYFEPV